MALPSPIFAPSSPEQLEHVLTDLTSPDLSLRNVAQNFDTTPGALAAWMTLPEVQLRLDQLESAAARHSRITAASALPRAVCALTELVADYTSALLNDNSSRHPPSLFSPADEHRRRRAESTRRAAWLLYRIATFYPGQPRVRQPNDTPRAHPTTPAATSTTRPTVTPAITPEITLAAAADFLARNLPELTAQDPIPQTPDPRDAKHAQETPTPTPTSTPAPAPTASPTLSPTPLKATTTIWSPAPRPAGLSRSNRPPRSRSPTESPVPSPA